MLCPLGIGCRQTGHPLHSSWVLGLQGVIQRNKLTPRLLKVFTDTGLDSIDAAVKVCSAVLHSWLPAGTCYVDGKLLPTRQDGEQFRVSVKSLFECLLMLPIL